MRDAHYSIKNDITGEVMKRDNVYRQPHAKLSVLWDSGVKSWRIWPDVVRAGCLQASCEIRLRQTVGRLLV